MKTKRYMPTDAELKNDPSLRWVLYRWGEAVCVDGLKERARFSRYDVGGRIVLTDLVLRELPGSVCPLSVRRP